MRCIGTSSPVILIIQAQQIIRGHVNCFDETN